MQRCSKSLLLNSIDGNKIVGFYQVGDSFAPRHGFVRDGAVWNTIDYPWSVETLAYGIDDNIVVGHWSDSTRIHGFFYDGSSWQSFDYPGSTSTIANDISGNRIVGLYFDQTGNSHSFLATIPAPTTLILVSIAWALVRAHRRQPGTQVPFRHG
jgi:hypothetical protein